MITSAELNEPGPLRHARAGARRLSSRDGGGLLFMFVFPGIGSVTVDPPLTRERNVGGSLRPKDAIKLAGPRIALNPDMQRIVIRVRRALQCGARVELERHAALELDATACISARRDADDAASGGGTGVNRPLDRRRVVRFSVTDRTKLADIERLYAWRGRCRRQTLS